MQSGITTPQKEEKAGEETYKCEIKNGVKKRLTGKKLRTGERNIQVGKLQRCWTLEDELVQKRNTAGSNAYWAHSFFPFFITRLWWNRHESILQHASLYNLLYNDAKQVVLRWNFSLFSKRWRVGTLVPSEEMSPDIRRTLRVKNLSFPAVFRT